ncbi:MAG: hypothetical protein K2N48_01290 [Muribaculaceae bacterium]|nr:hypothetical protein [Muribaculaceae bacterium]
MKETKNNKAAKTAGKVTIKVAYAVDAFRLLSQQNEQGKQGFKLSGLETEDIFKVLFAIKALKPIAVELVEFEKDVRKQFEPEDWNERKSKFDEMSNEEQAAMNREFLKIEGKVRECLTKEREKEKEIEGYERLDKETFAKLIKSNEHIEDSAVNMLLMEVLM